MFCDFFVTVFIVYRKMENYLKVPDKILPINKIKKPRNKSATTLLLVTLGRLERSTHGLEGRCSIQLSYRLISLTTPKTNCFRKAGDGNRTHVSSLEGWCSTIELHPQFAETVKVVYSIGVTGFEPAASWSQTRRSSQAEPHPAVFLYLFVLRCPTQDILYVKQPQMSTPFFNFF